MKQIVKRFALNTTGRDLIVGDIHGHFTKLRAALDEIGFNPERDRLFSVGDLVDRGPECDQAIEWLHLPWFHAVQGNHEDMAIRWPNGHMDPYNYAANGGGWNISNPPDVQAEIAAALGALPIAIELQTADGLVGIVHAECPTQAWADFTGALGTGWVRSHDGELKQSKREVDHLIDQAQWSRRRVENMLDDHIAGVRAVVVGHTPMESWTSLGNTIYIDTGGWLPETRFPGRRFTILDAATLQPAQAPSTLCFDDVAMTQLNAALGG